MSNLKLEKAWTIEKLSRYVSVIVAKESGNILGENQLSMVMSRMNKRLIDLGRITPEDYYHYLSNNFEVESNQLITILTTHHTFFFREFSHFEFVLSKLEQIKKQVKQRGEAKIRVLSLACSRGHEVYSLGMFFKHHLKGDSISFELWGTDIDHESIKIANNGVYPYKEVKSIPQVYQHGNWKRGTGKISNFAKIKDDIKKHCHFSTANILDAKSSFKGEEFDIIFCRNLFIYFNNETIKKTVLNLQNKIYPGGFLITGLSESLKNLDLEMKTLAPSVYNFDKVAPEESVIKSVTTPKVEVVPAALSPIPSPIKILVVDDSPSVVKILSKIFQKDSDFEVVATATNGLEAIEQVKNKKIDAMTLDIHMPKMDGVEYLKSNFTTNHPKVVMVSSASREDTRYAQAALSYGAIDFVEKPALNNLAQRAEEIKNKIKMSFLVNDIKLDRNVDQQFLNDYKVTNLNDKARYFFLNFSDLDKVIETLKEIKGEQPASFLFFEGNMNYLDLIKEKVQSKIHGKKILVYNIGDQIKPNNTYICDFGKHGQELFKSFNAKVVSCSIFGICSKIVEESLFELENAQILLEDIREINKDLKKVATDIFPWTSFSHLSTEFLSKTNIDKK